jgi:hypothetical protein
MENKKQYAMIQVTSEIHELVKEYCNQNGYKIGSLVSILIRKHIKNKK